MGIDQDFPTRLHPLYALIKFKPISMTLKTDEEVHFGNKVYDGDSVQR